MPKLYTRARSLRADHRILRQSSHYTGNAILVSKDSIYRDCSNISGGQRGPRYFTWPVWPQRHARQGRPPDPSQRHHRTNHRVDLVPPLWFNGTTSRPGPILFIAYSAEVINIVELHGLRDHALADDLHVYGHIDQDAASSLVVQMVSCIEHVNTWMI